MPRAVRVARAVEIRVRIVTYEFVVAGHQRWVCEIRFVYGADAVA